MFTVSDVKDQKYVFMAIHLTPTHRAAAVLHPFAIDVVGIMYVCCSVCRLLISDIFVLNC